MSIFKYTNEQSKAMDDFIDNIEIVAKKLANGSNESDIKEIYKLQDNLKLKVKDFFRDERKLNIGVIGQVKAGKSSFLNTLLFNGQEILPKASTPKTATLTKMEYSDKNIISVEYYSQEDWDVLKENASIDLEDEIYTSAREIMSMLNCSGIDPEIYIKKEVEEISFDTYDELVKNLNDYVGENGKFTPIVKAVSLYLNKEEFKEISIVDTPGLNDPIVSRTIRTKEFMEICDVVFFLSQSGSFLDKSDWELLSSQLPQKGVKKLILIASKYDSGIRDVLRHKDEDDIFGDDDVIDTVQKADKIIGQKLKKRAREKVKEFTENLRLRNMPENMISVIEGCSEPIMVSSMCCNMTLKPTDEYDEEEKNIYNALKEFSTNIEDDLASISNMKKINDIFENVINEKENILIEKAKSFIPTNIQEFKQLLEALKEKSSKKLSLISENDREQLLEQKKSMEYQINSIKSEIYTLFGEINNKLETEKISALKELREGSKEYSNVSEKAGTVTKTRSYTVSTSKWYNPFSWGTSRTEYYDYEEHYSYIDTSDAIENLRNYAKDSASQIEEVFIDAIKIKEIKRKVLNIIVNNFDMGDEKHDSSLFRIIVEKTLSNIEFPTVKIDISKSINSIAAKFSGEVTSSDDRSNLKQALAHAIEELFESICEKLTYTLNSFKTSMNSIKDEIQSSILMNITEEFNDIMSKYENKEKEIALYKQYIDNLEKEIIKL